jgi:hypothetical protein
MNVVERSPDLELAQRLRAYANQLEVVQEKLLTMPQIDIPVKNYFSHGVYAREIVIPKGVIVIGKIHKYRNLNIMSKGYKSVLTENGVVRIRAPFTVVSPPGTKRIGYTHEETVWTTIHGTHETDVAKIEQEFIAQTQADYELFCQVMRELEDTWAG